ncbi:MAG: hypothetical protein KIC46_06410 [Clostridiales bacterium]|nr:hypothetical protein [Clostridiales bacterium]
MEEAKKKRKNKRIVILTVVMMTAVFLFLVYLNQRPYAHIEVQSLSDLHAEQIVQTACSKMRLKPEDLRVTPSGKVTFDVDENGKLIRPLQFDLHGISGENVQTGTLLLRKPGLYLYRNQTEKLPKNYENLPEYAQDFDLSTFLAALHDLPVTQAAQQIDAEKVLFYTVEWVYDTAPSDTLTTLVWKNGQVQQQEHTVAITDREKQCLFTVMPHTGHISDYQDRVQIVMEMGK